MFESRVERHSLYGIKTLNGYMYFRKLTGCQRDPRVGVSHLIGRSGILPAKRHLLGYGQNIQSGWNINAAEFKIFIP